MSKVLIKWSDNWADEMDIEGFVIEDKEKAEKWLDNMKSITRPFDICIGTNEEVDYDNGEKFSETISMIDMTEEDEKAFIKLFGKNKWGCGFGFTSFYQEFWEYNRFS